MRRWGGFARELHRLSDDDDEPGRHGAQPDDRSLKASRFPPQANDLPPQTDGHDPQELHGSRHHVGHSSRDGCRSDHLGACSRHDAARLQDGAVLHDGGAGVWGDAAGPRDGATVDREDPDAKDDDVPRDQDDYQLRDEPVNHDHHRPAGILGLGP